MSMLARYIFFECKQMPRVARANKPQSKEWTEKNWETALEKL